MAAVEEEEAASFGSHLNGDLDPDDREEGTSSTAEEAAKKKRRKKKKGKGAVSGKGVMFSPGPARNGRAERLGSGPARVTPGPGAPEPGNPGPWLNRQALAEWRGRLPPVPRRLGDGDGGRGGGGGEGGELPPLPEWVALRVTERELSSHAVRATDLKRARGSAPPSSHAVGAPPRKKKKSPVWTVVRGLLPTPIFVEAGAGVGEHTLPGLDALRTPRPHLHRGL